ISGSSGATTASRSKPKQRAICCATRASESASSTTTRPKCAAPPGDSLADTSTYHLNGCSPLRAVRIVILSDSEGVIHEQETSRRIEGEGETGLVYDEVPPVQQRASKEAREREAVEAAAATTQPTPEARRISEKAGFRHNERLRARPPSRHARRRRIGRRAAR